jgi:hypothetical protein
MGTGFTAFGILFLVTSGLAGSTPTGQSPTEIVLPRFAFSLDSLRIERREGFDDLELHGAILQHFQDRLGHPLLPTLKLDVIIPADKKIASVVVTVADPVQVPDSIIPRPIQRSPELDGTFPPPVPPDATIYDSPNPYPADLGAVAVNGSMRGYRLGSVVVYPLQYVGRNQRLTLHRTLDVTVRLAPLSGEELSAMVVRDPARYRNTLEGTEIEWLKRFVRNPDDFDRFYRGTREEGGAESLTAITPFGGFDPTELPSTDGPPVEYVIITDSLTVDGANIGGTVVTEFQRLADWKTSKGTPAVVRTVTWIRNNYSGPDDAAKIRSFLVDAFRLWGTDYVLLGGDLRVVPGRRFSGEQEAGGLPLEPGQPPADVYFGGLDNDWDLDNDGIFGEWLTDIAASDPFWDVWVGRVPLDTMNEAKDFVDRTLTYARAPGQDLSNVKLSYYERILLMAGLSNVFNTDDWNNDLNGMFIAESIGRKLEGLAFTAQRHYQPLQADASCNYHDTYLETFAQPNLHDWTTQAVRDSLSTGFGFVHHHEHSSQYHEGGYGLNWGGHGPPFAPCFTCCECCGSACCKDGNMGREDIDRLTNKPNWSVVFSTGSGVNAFDYESVSENWLSNPNGGAVVYIGKTRSSTGSVTGEVDTLTFNNIFNLTMPVGQALAKATESTTGTTSRVVSSYELLGDPELRPWKKRPGTLQVTVSPTTFTPGDQQFITVTVKDSVSLAVIPAARVAIKQTDRLYAFDLTDSQGKHAFDVTVQSPDTIFVVVTATDYSPVRMPIPKNLLSSSVKHVTYKSHTAADDSAGMANNNGVIDAGEAIKLDLQVQNIGSTAAGGVTGKLYATGTARFGVTVDGTYQASKIWMGAGDQHPPDLVTDSTFTYPDFHGLDFRGRPAKYDTSTAGGLFLWRERNLWNVIARGNPTGGAVTYRGSITTRGGLSNTTTTALEADDLVSFVTADSIYFKVVVGSGGPADQDHLSFVAKEVNWVTVTDSTGTFGHLEPNGTAQDRFVVRMLNPIADRHEPVFELMATDSLANAVGTSQFTLPVAAPVLSYLRQIPTVNPICFSGICETIDATVINAGSGVADSVRTRLTLTTGTGTVTDSIIVFDTVSALTEKSGGSDVFTFNTGDTTVVRFKVDLSNFYPDGSVRVITKTSIDVVRPGRPTGVFVQPFQGRSETVTWTAPVSTSDLAGFNIHRRLSDEASFTRVASAPFDSTTRFQDVLLQADTTYVYAVASQDLSGNESALSGTAFGNDTWPAIHSGWPKTIDAGTPSSPVAVDIDSSGTKEIFVTGNSVYAWRADGTPVIAANSDGLFFKPSGNISQGTTGRFSSTPAIGDLDRDTNFEIVVTAWDDNIYVLNEQGQIRWQRYCVPKWSSPALGDIDGDDSLEVFVGSDFDTLYAWRHNGKPVIANNPTGAFVRLPDGAIVNYATPSLANLDGVTNTTEVVYGTNKGNIYAWKLSGGAASQLWSFPSGVNRPMSTVAIGDVDNDGTLEVVAAQGRDGLESNNILWILNGTTGALEDSVSGPVQIPGSLSNVANQWIHPPSLADLDGDGDPEILVGTQGVSDIYQGTRVLTFQHTGVGPSSTCADSIPVPGLNQTSSSFNYVNGGIAVANLDYDNDLELLGGSSNFGLFMWDESCKAELGWPMTLFGEVDGTTWVGDVDNDGLFEMIVKGLEHRVHILDLRIPYESTKVEWGQFAHDTHHTSRYGATVGGRVVGSGPLVLALTQNVPNPFNPVTWIEYSLKEREHVVLSIYDLNGRLVRELVREVQPSGAHKVQWDGRNSRGEALASGVYFYRFEAGQFLDTRKMLLLK